MAQNNAASALYARYEKESVFKKVGEYELTKEIGQGSFARVYRARHPPTQQVYAVKMIPLENLNQNTLQQIEKEIEILQRLRHRHIICMHDFRKTQNNWYLVFEYCEHGDLVKYIKRFYKGNVMPESHVRKTLQQLSEAFKELKRHSIVHRDLKLANILISGDFDVKIADFGFARYNAENELLQTYCGTPITMAPEVLRRGEKYDELVDIWSLGVMIYQMLYGRAPFLPKDGHGIDELLRAIQTGHLTFDQQQPVSDDAKDLMARMLVVDAHKRLTFEQLFAHAWIASAEAPEHDESAPQLLRSVFVPADAKGGDDSTLAPTNAHRKESFDVQAVPRKRSDTSGSNTGSGGAQRAAQQSQQQQLQQQHLQPHTVALQIARAYAHEVARVTDECDNMLAVCTAARDAWRANTHVCAQQRAVCQRLAAYGGVLVMQRVKSALTCAVSVVFDAQRATGKSHFAPSQQQSSPAISAEKVVFFVSNPAAKRLADAYAGLYGITKECIEVLARENQLDADQSQCYVRTLAYRELLRQAEEEYMTPDLVLQEREFALAKYDLCLAVTGLLRVDAASVPIAQKYVVAAPAAKEDHGVLNANYQYAQQALADEKFCGDVRKVLESDAFALIVADVLQQEQRASAKDVPQPQDVWSVAPDTAGALREAENVQDVNLLYTTWQDIINERKNPEVLN